MIAQRVCEAVRWPVWRAPKCEPQTVVMDAAPRHMRKRASWVLELALMLALALLIPGPRRGK